MKRLAILTAAFTLALCVPPTHNPVTIATASIMADAVQTPTLSAGVKATINAIWPQVAQLHRGNDDERREGTKRIIEQIVFSHPGEGYGWKSSSPTNPPSKDAIARRVDGRLYYIDIVNGGSRELADLNGPMGDITGQHFIPLVGVNHLGGVPPPPPPATCERCSADLAAAHLILTQQRDALDVAARRIVDLELERDTATGRAVNAEQENARLNAALANVRCRAKAPAWLKIGCEIVR